MERDIRKIKEERYKEKGKKKEVEGGKGEGKGCERWNEEEKEDEGWYYRNTCGRRGNSCRNYLVTRL